jgi:hypothetical protein
MVDPGAGLPRTSPNPSPIKKARRLTSLQQQFIAPRRGTPGPLRLTSMRYGRYWRNVWSGRASQEGFVDLAVRVLHQCIRPLIEAVASGHHGYQRTYDLISG